MDKRIGRAHAGDELEKLTDSGLELADPAQDIRGRKVRDRDGKEIGYVSSLFIDVQERKVRMLEIRTGGFLGIGDRHFLIPVDAVADVSPDEVHVNASRERVVHSPAYDPAIVNVPTRQYWEPYYGYYGLSPYWGSAYRYPGFPLAPNEQPIEDDGHVHTRDL